MANFWEHLQNLTDAQSIISYGFYFLLIIVFAETGIFFGFFLPGDYLLFMAGILNASGKLDVSIYTLIISLIIAGVLGNFVGYWFGYRAGPALFKRRNSFFFKQTYVQLAENFFCKYGGMALVLGRFFPIIRTFAPIFAGVVKYDFKKFSFFNFIGSIAWVSFFTLSGFFLGHKYPQIKNYLIYIILGLLIVTSVPLAIAFLKTKMAHKRNIIKN